MPSTDPRRPAYRSLADELRDLPTQRLRHLLLARPDLATPAPRDSGQLASRAATRASVLRALDQLNRWELLVLHSLAVTAQTPDWEPADVLKDEKAGIEQAIAKLVDLALVWHSPDGLRVLTTVPDALTSGPAQARLALEPFAGDAMPRAEVERRLAALSAPARALLDHVHAAGGRGTTNDDPAVAVATGTPTGLLLAAGLLRPHRSGELRIPPEVALVLGVGLGDTPTPTPPTRATSAREARVVDRAGAGAAAEAVRKVGLLLESWGTQPPALLRGGGLAVRDLRAAARLLGVEEREAALWVETAAAADLLAETTGSEGDPVWAPTDAYDAFTTRSVAEQWTRLARAWLNAPRLPGLVTERTSAATKPPNALTADVASPTAVELRHLVLSDLADLRDSTDGGPNEVLATGTGLPSLVDRVAWLRPRSATRREQIVAWTMEEAALLGCVALGGITAAGRALVRDDASTAAALLDDLLPAPVDKVLLQADLTAVAPGPLEAELARRLHLVADLESAGGAGVYRFRASSVRRAFDVGWSAAEVHAFLDEIAATPVPQPLTYLIDDVARTFGSVRVGHAEAFLRGDDEAALAALVHDPRAASLGLRQIAPSVVISTTPLDVLLPRLRELGAAPVVEAPDGTVRIARPDLVRARLGRERRGAAPTQAARAAAHTEAVITALRAGDAAAATRPMPEATTGATTSPAEALAVLRGAVESRESVRISYVDNHGSFAERIVDPHRVEGGQLTAYDHRSDAERTFAVHRITAVVALGAHP